MDRCPNCNLELGCHDGFQHGCMEGDFEIMYGRELCPACRMDCRHFRSDDSPGNEGQWSGSFRKCGGSSRS